MIARRMGKRHRRLLPSKADEAPAEDAEAEVTPAPTTPAPTKTRGDAGAAGHQQAVRRPARPIVPTSGHAPPTASGQAMVQIAAVSRPQDADVLVAALRQRGYGVVVRSEPQDNLLHVQVGRLPIACRLRRSSRSCCLMGITRSSNSKSHVANSGFRNLVPQGRLRGLCRGVFSRPPAGLGRPCKSNPGLTSRKRLTYGIFFFKTPTKSSSLSEAPYRFIA